MPAIELPEGVHRKVRLLGRAWATTDADVVRRLIDEFEQGGLDEPSPPTGPSVPIHLLYEGHRISAEFDPETEAVVVVDGPLAGHRYRKPSSAAVAVIQRLNPSVTPNRNGWATWIVSDTGKRLQSLRRRRRS